MSLICKLIMVQGLENKVADSPFLEASKKHGHVALRDMVVNVAMLG